MSRTDIDAATFANYLRQMCGDGSVEWSYEPMQTSVLLDMADMLDENAKLREQLEDMDFELDKWQTKAHFFKQLADIIMSANDQLRELVRDYDRCTMHADCDKCEYDGKLSTHCPLSSCFPDSNELRELGVEVDDG